MHNLIRRTADWLWLLFAPGTGRHRAGARRAPQSLTAVPHPRSCPAHHSRRCLYDRGLVLNTHTDPHGRPHPLTTYDDERARQRRRRLALVLAADFGIDLDRHLIGARHLAVAGKAAA